MQLNLRDCFLNTRDATSVIVDNNNFREAFKDCLNNNLVVARCYNNDNAKKKLCKNQIICKEQ